MELEATKYPISPGIDSRGFANTTTSKCGYTLTCASGTLFFSASMKMEKNFRCSFLVLANGFNEYEVNVINIDLEGVRTVLTSYQFDEDVVGHTIL